jgi:hypothetical protein
MTRQVVNSPYNIHAHTVHEFQPSINDCKLIIYTAHLGRLKSLRVAYTTYYTVADLTRIAIL